MTSASRFGESVPVHKLADGYEIPTLALGVWQTPEGTATKDAVRWALELGYRHIDTAQGYGNEQSVGEGFRQSGLDRDRVFITTKFYPGAKDPVREIEASLQRLRLEYVDLYLVHWPQGGPTWAWPGMERAQSLGYPRSIGVSNFDVNELEQVFAAATSPPVANQINLNPFSYRRSWSRRTGAATWPPRPTARSEPGGIWPTPGCKRSRTASGRSPSQVLIRWGLQHGFVVLPKSTHRERIAENVGRPRVLTLGGRDDRARRARRGIAPGAALERKWW